MSTSQAGEAPTPARNTRLRSRTPLPAVSTKQSQAYGAKGKTELRSQVRGGTADFASAFASGRTVAARNASASVSISRRSSPESPETTQPVHGAQTTMDSMAGYHGGGITARRPVEIKPERPVQPPPPNRLYLWLLGLLILFSGCIIGTLVNSGSNTAASPWNLFSRSGRSDLGLLQRLIGVENRVVAVESELQYLTGDTLAEIRRLLPQSVVLRYDNGRYEIPVNFWSALQERLVEDSDLTPRWQAWLSQNENQIMELQEQHLHSIFDNAVETKHFMTREQFMKAIKENNDWIAEQYSQELKSMWRHNAKNLKALTQDAAKEILDRSAVGRFAKEQVDVLAQANQLHAANLALRVFNFFSVGSGARIDPRMTSPTAGRRQSSWLAETWSGINPYGLEARPPVEALQKWDEAGECWCGAPEATGAAIQIGVLTNNPVYPGRLIIEHSPAQATLDIAAAPRLFEVWADAGSAKEAERLDAIIQRDMQPWEAFTCGPKPKSSFVCIGKDEYDIHNYNHVQAFSTLFANKTEAFSTNRIVVRVNTNWGADHTCIYRLRMTGTLAE